MKIILKLSSLMLVCSLLSACASESLKAPCNHYASFCGTKTKINSW